jgi:hypothetical protein
MKKCPKHMPLYMIGSYWLSSLKIVSLGGSTGARAAFFVVSGHRGGDRPPRRDFPEKGRK